MNDTNQTDIFGNVTPFEPKSPENPGVNQNIQTVGSVPSSSVPQPDPEPFIVEPLVQAPPVANQTPTQPQTVVPNVPVEPVVQTPMQTPLAQSMAPMTGQVKATNDMAVNADDSDASNGGGLFAAIKREAANINAPMANVEPMQTVASSSNPVGNLNPTIAEPLVQAPPVANQNPVPTQTIVPNVPVEQAPMQTPPVQNVAPMGQPVSPVPTVEPVQMPEITPVASVELPSVDPTPVEDVPIVEIPPEEKSQSFNEMPFAGVNQQTEEGKKVTVLESRPATPTNEGIESHESNMQPIEKKVDENSGLKFLLVLALIFAIVIIFLPFL